MMGNRQTPSIESDPDGYARTMGYRDYAQMRAFLLRQRAEGGQPRPMVAQPSPTQTPAPPPAAHQPQGGMSALFNYIARAMGGGR